MQSKINLVLISYDAKFVLVSFKEQQRWDDENDGSGGGNDGDNDDDNWHRHKNYHDEHTQMYANAIDRAHTLTHFTQLALHFPLTIPENICHFHRYHCPRTLHECCVERRTFVGVVL